MKITKSIVCGLVGVGLALASPIHAVSSASNGANDAPSLAERLSDKPRKGFLPLEFKLNDWTVSPWGYLRLAYESVENDKRYDFIGRNDGFILDNARLGLDVHYRDQVEMLVSIEAASDLHKDTNTPIGETEVRLRDGYLRYDPFTFIGLQAGQFKAPFAAEELRGTSSLLFVSRAVGWEGVLPGRGFEEDPIALDRQLGAMLSPKTPIRFGDFGAAYYFMVGNGNGSNQLLNDNSRVAYIGRLEAMYSNFVTLGAAGFGNERTIGDPPNRAREDDVGVAADLLINPDPIEVFFQFGQVETDFPTAGVSSRIRRAWHVQVGYRIDTPWSFNVTPAYRYAYYDPWANAGSNSSASENALALDYHTFGLKLALADLPLSFLFNYTLTEEQTTRGLDNDRIQLLGQVIF